MLLAIVFFATVTVALSQGIPPVSLRDDANHFNKSDTQNELWYTEWVYFNLQCERLNLAAIYVYGTWNEGNVDGLGASYLFALHYNLTTGRVAQVVDLEQSSVYSSSYEKADVTFRGVNRFVAQDLDTYHAWGQTSDGSAAWNYTLKRDGVPSWFIENNHDQLTLHNCTLFFFFFSKLSLLRCDPSLQDIYQHA